MTSWTRSTASAWRREENAVGAWPLDEAEAERRDSVTDENEDEYEEAADEEGNGEGYGGDDDTFEVHEPV